jgi:molybdopterin-synthase adenylyltransferase
MYKLNKQSLTSVKEPAHQPLHNNSHSLPIKSGPGYLNFSEDEEERYARQILLFGIETQNRLKYSHALIAGTGGLGSPIAFYLAAAGVGTLTLIDHDRVSLSNLNRQILHGTSDLGNDKTRSAKRKLRDLNPLIQIITWNEKITRMNLSVMAHDADIIIDATDNFETRYILNEFAVNSGIPFIHGAVNGFSGQMFVVIPKKTACLSCLFKNPPPEQVNPVIGVTPGIIGSMQAGEAIKILTGCIPEVAGKFICWDGINTTLKSLHVRKNDNCPVCGRNPEKLKSE